MKIPPLRRTLIPSLLVAVCVLLAANLAVQMLILRRMPPTVGEYGEAQGTAKEEIAKRIPMTDVTGSVRVRGTVDAHVSGGRVEAEVDEPLEVKVRPSYY